MDGTAKEARKPLSRLQHGSTCLLTCTLSGFSYLYPPNTQAERNSELARLKAEEEERLATVLSRRQHEAERSQREVQQLREQSEELRA